MNAQDLQHLTTDLERRFPMRVLNPENCRDVAEWVADWLGQRGLGEECYGEDYYIDMFADMFCSDPKVHAGRLCCAHPAREDKCKHYPPPKVTRSKVNTAKKP